MTDFDFIIIGSGVAGLSAAQYGARANLATLVLDGANFGGQALHIDKLENYPGVYPAINGMQLAQVMKNQALEFGAQFASETVQSIDKMQGVFVVKTANAQYRAKAVLLATGAHHRKLGIAGEDAFLGRGVSYCATCDGPFFRGKRITVIGGGDAACDEAQFLSTMTDSVFLVHRRNKLRAQAKVAERVLTNARINVMLNKVPVEIRGEQLVKEIILRDSVTGEEFAHKTDAVFIFVGMEPQSQLIEIVKRDDAGYIITDENMQTSVAGLFAAGDVRAKAFRQIVTACADGAYAAHGAEAYIRAL